MPTKSAYSTEKLGRNHVAIFKDGEYLCQLRPNEVAGWIFRMERSDRNDAESAIAAKGYQRERVLAYLARRASRAPQPIQTAFDF